MTVYNFLEQPTEDRLQREMQNICDSYSHPWDVLAELLQNSVDAIRAHLHKHPDSGHSINITIDRRNKSIKIRDSGIGITSGDVTSLLAPHGSDKSKKPDQIGEKGVGLTYVIFSSNCFKINTCSTHDSFSGEITNALLWRNDKAELPVLVGESKESATDPVNTYTEITASEIDDSDSENPESIFNMNMPALSCILRTKTAIGSTKEKPEPIQAQLTLVYEDGKSNKMKIPFKYLYPEELLGKGKWYDYDEFIRKAAQYNDQEKTKHLQGKGLRIKGSEKRANREISYSAFFVPSRRTWEEINRKNELIIKTIDGEEQHLYTAGIEVATKGMPTTVSLQPSLTGQSGYWPNIHILIQDDSLLFDIGRKSIPGRTQGLLKEIATNVFRELTKFAKLMGTDPPIKVNETLAHHNKEQRFNELEKLPNLHIDDIPYLKQPDSQECAVVALFHELSAANYLKGYRTLKTGYKETYDLWGYYELRDDTVGQNLQNQVKMGEKLPIIIEFKYRLESILADVDNNIKNFADIDLLVCWDINEDEFARYSIHINTVNKEEALFHGVNYELNWPAAYNLGAAGKKPVIALRHYIDSLSRDKLKN